MFISKTNVVQLESAVIYYARTVESLIHRQNVWIDIPHFFNKMPNREEKCPLGDPQSIICTLMINDCICSDGMSGYLLVLVIALVTRYPLPHVFW